MFPYVCVITIAFVFLLINFLILFSVTQNVLGSTSANNILKSRSFPIFAAAR